ncbi:MAG: M4 family metallopeptidase [Bacteroidota bacterium]
MNNAASVLLTLVFPLVLNAQENPEIANADTRYSGQRAIVTDFHQGQYRLRDYTRAYEGILTRLYNGGIPNDPIDFYDSDNEWTMEEYDNPALENSILDAHWAGEMTYDYFKNSFSRDSWNDDGGAINIFLTDDGSLPSATTLITFSSSDSIDGISNVAHLFRFPVTHIDIVAHEIAHAIESTTSNLLSTREQGALREGLCDIWGICVKQFAKPESNIWQQGPLVEYLLNFADPKDRERPDTYKGEYWRDTNCIGNFGQDGCWVHTNSGVLSHWFYLLSEGSAQTDEINDNGDSFQVSGIGIDKAAKIVYRLQTVYLNKTSEYLDARNFGIQAAEDLFGAGSAEYIATQNAFFAVGLGASYQPECGAIVAQSTANGLTLQNLTAPIEIIKVYASDNRLVFECNNTCGTDLQIPNLTAGTYRIDIQSFTANWQAICSLTKFVEVGVTSNPCANQGGDGDQDGFCDAVDCAPNNSNLPAAPNSSCDDGNPNTTDDKIDAGGCTCSGTLIDNGETGSNCDDLQFTVENDQIIVEGLTTVSKVELLGENTDWQSVIICDGNCDTSQAIPALVEGDYTVKVNLLGLDNTYCYREATVTVTDDGGNTGGGAVDCEALTFTSENEQITVGGLAADSKVEMIGQNTDWRVVTICDGNCQTTQVIPDLAAGDYTVKVNQFGDASEGSSYCYREEKVTVSADGGNVGDGSADCDNLVFTTDGGQITVSGLTASYDKVEIIGQNTNWQVLTICEGDCGNSQVITDLAEGMYQVKVNQGGEGSYCYREESVVVTTSSQNRNSPLLLVDALAIYPNPVRHQLHVELYAIGDQTGTLQVFNALGQLTQQWTNVAWQNGITTLDLSDYENGMYWLAVQLDGQRPMTRRFVVEHWR